MSDRKIIELDGQKWELVNRQYQFEGEHIWLGFRKVPKPLYEEWLVLDKHGKKRGYTCQTEQKAKADCEMLGWNYGDDAPYRVVHMREVREEK